MLINAAATKNLILDKPDIVFQLLSTLLSTQWGWILVGKELFNKRDICILVQLIVHA